MSNEFIGTWTAKDISFVTGSCEIYIYILTKKLHLKRVKSFVKNITVVSLTIFFLLL